MNPPTDSYAESLKLVRDQLIELMKGKTPYEAALLLEKAGWSREWACAAVEKIEYSHNPARLVPDAKRSQATRESLQSRFALGVGLLVIGLLVSLGTLFVALSVGGWVFIAYGAVITGFGMCAQTLPLLRRYPDRPLPRYVPPKDARVHDPGSF
jgi:hypothetical protein